MDTLNNLLKALAEALVPFIRDALGAEALDPVTGVLTEDTFDPSDFGLMTEDTFDPADWNLLRDDEFDPTAHGLVCEDDLGEWVREYLEDNPAGMTRADVEEAIDSAVANLSITRG
jgi:hypothetical protein